MDEGLDFVIAQIGSGNAFFAGVALLLLGILLSCRPARRWLILARNLSIFSGGILIAVSATPLPWWAYTFLAAATLIWFALEQTRAKLGNRILGCRAGLFLLWLLAAGFELPYHISPVLPCLGSPTLFLLGDSISAGMTEAEKGTWPKLLAESHHVEVRDFSKMGATASSAHKQAERIGDESGLVLLEIGGNDLLGSTTADQFEERLELLLGGVCRPGRLVVMLELPLPPFANRFGTIQRRLAEKHHVILIPKRILIGVLTTRGATVDGIHLSPRGHALMAGAMWEVLRMAWRGGDNRSIKKRSPSALSRRQIFDAV